MNVNKPSISKIETSIKGIDVTVNPVLLMLKCKKLGFVVQMFNTFVCLYLIILSFCQIWNHHPTTYVVTCVVKAQKLKDYQVLDYQTVENT